MNALTTRDQIVFMTGVSGSGKSLIGQLLARKFQWPYFEGDDFHSLQNKKKMKLGVPLTDEDRLPWLEKLNEVAVSQTDTGAVISCSALKEKYRAILRKGIPVSKICWVFLDGTYEIISKRMEQRKGHFMPTHLLQSQFDILEKPKEAIVIDVSETPETIVAMIQKELQTKMTAK